MENLIVSKNLSMVANAPYYACVYNIYSFSNEEDLIALKIENEVLILKEKLDVLDIMLVQTRSSGKTKKLQLLDNNRDCIIRMMQYTFKVMEGIGVENQMVAARELHRILRKYGSHIENRPYEDETVTINNLLQDFSDPTMTTYLEALNLDDWVVQLKETNDEFLSVYQDRNSDQSEFVKGGTDDARKEVQNAFEQLCKMIEAYAAIDGEEAYLHLAARMNTEIANAQSESKRRSTKNDNDDDLNK